MQETVCCIYHKPRAADESSDEDSSDSSSDSDSDSEPDNSTARPAGRAGGSRGRRPHQHSHDDCGDGHDAAEGSSKPRRQRRKPSPNAYEKMPKQKK
jgi:protein phosphatase 1 regulatory subunit 11